MAFEVGVGVPLVKDCVDSAKLVDELSNLELLLIKEVMLRLLSLIVLPAGVDLLLELSEDVLEPPELVVSLLVLVVAVGIGSVFCVLTVLPALPVRS